MGTLLQSIAQKVFTSQELSTSLSCVRVNLWYRGACPTRQTGTMAGEAYLGGWTGMDTSPPLRLIPRWVARRMHVVHIPNWKCALRHCYKRDICPQHHQAEQSCQSIDNTQA